MRRRWRGSLIRGGMEHVASFEKKKKESERKERDEFKRLIRQLEKISLKIIRERGEL